MSDENRQWILTRRPEGRLTADDFEFTTARRPEPGDGEVLVQVLLLSIDPANRAWMHDVRTYRDPVRVGEPMDGLTLCRVLQSRADGFAEGDLVECSSGWQEYAIHRGKELFRVEPCDPLTHRLSVYGLTGLTAYFGLLEVGRVQTSETVVVSAAAGAVGSVVGQIAKIKGCRAVGIAGSAEKCAWLREIGFDAAIDYKTQDVATQLATHCEGGIDVYFDNVGGAVLQAALLHMRERGRIVCCGSVSGYEATRPVPGPLGIPGLLTVRRLRMEGFIVMDHFARRAQAQRDLQTWVGEGRLVVREDVLEGLEQAPQALIGLLAGDNVGKRMVRVAPGG